MEPRTRKKEYELYRQSKEVLKKRGFNLQKFVTNASQLQQTINDEEKVSNSSDKSVPVHSSEETYTKETLGPVQEMHSGEQKILGVQWNTSTE